MQIEKTIKIYISDKDIEIVRLVADGDTRAAIGDKMNLSARTIEAKIHKMMQIFGAVSCINLISIFYKEGILKADWSSKTLMELVDIKREKVRLGNIPAAQRDVLYSQECDLYVKREQIAWQQAYKILEEVETKDK